MRYKILNSYDNHLHNSMKTLYLLRHAKSSWNAPYLEDKDRPLSDRGVSDIPIVSARLRKNSSIEAIISSTALRAFTTANLIAEEIGFPVESVISESAIYLSGPLKLLEIVRKLDDRLGEVMLVCHNPTITEFANCMLGAHHIDNIPTCGLVKLRLDTNSWVHTAFEKGTLMDFNYPKKEI